ncbi:MAG: hypothetical protein IPJ88_03245 [Myxococcales bacterium]|nr:MAG: hypothetical protein IPJ88_03245 [Myxococcales bacterium]
MKVGSALVSFLYLIISASAWAQAKQADPNDPAENADKRYDFVGIPRPRHRREKRKDSETKILRRSWPQNGVIATMVCTESIATAV